MIDDLVVTEAHSPSELNDTKKEQEGKKKEGFIDYYILINVSESRVRTRSIFFPSQCQPSFPRLSRVEPAAAEGRTEGGILHLEGADHYQWPISSPQWTAVGSKWIHRRVGCDCASPD